MNAQNILQDIINSFDPEKFVNFFRSVNTHFRPYQTDTPNYNDEDFTNSYKIGEIPFSSVEKLVIYSFKVNRNLTERSGKKAQYEKGKRILRDELSDAGLFIFYDVNGNFRFSLIYADYLGPRRQWSSFKRFTYFVSPEEPNRTFLQMVGGCDFSSFQVIKDAFSVEKVTDEFFEAYRYAIYEIIIKSLEDRVEFRKKHSFAQQLLSRILFIYFLQKKGWLKWKNYVQDKHYLRNLWMKYKEYVNKNKDKKNTFYSSWLSSLFFGAFNKQSRLIDKTLPEEIQESFINMPFLNGGLFSKNELDEIDFNVPDTVFEWLFEPDLTTGDKKKGFLEIFNFTIDESLPLDIEVAVDPEMLGEVYESLVTEEERESSAIFYTQRVEIDLMCRLSLVEYLYNETNFKKTELIDLVFNPSESIPKFDEEKARIIKSTLEKVKIVDPAVGSASFLVGMMNVLTELHSELIRKLENHEENLFALKQKIVLENLYGVDVKDWAVMVGELRLWLSLIIETDEKYMDIYTKPLLPNLSFKIRQGDSLVEEIGGIQVSLRGDAIRYIPSDIKNKIKLLIDKKNSFFSGQISADKKELKEIEKLEQDIFSDILKSKISETDEKISSLKELINKRKGQKNLYGKEDTTSQREAKEFNSQIKELEKEKERFKKVLNNLKNKSKKEYFLWEIDFAEVFAEKGGFDIVIGNPPYVRQEVIAPPLENKANYTDEEWRQIKAKYKEKLIASVKGIWRDVEKIDKKSDLYVYFYFHGLSLLKKGGIFCFINSNSWLDVEYGAGLQEFLLKKMRPIYIIDNLKKRSFKQADVNTVIVLIQRPIAPLQDYTIKFIAFKKLFEEVTHPKVIKKMELYNEPLFDDEDLRIFPKTKKELLLEGVEISEENKNQLINLEPEHLPYLGNKWGGKYLRAPEIYFKILEKGKGKLVRLGDIAEIRRGFTTGANEFFYLKPIGISVKEVVEIAEKNPDALIPVRNGAGWEGEIEAEFLKPVIKSPKELKTIIVRLEDLNYLVFMCNKDKKDLAGTRALEYIKWGERQKYQNRPTCRSRERWWNLGVVDFQIVYPSTHNPSWTVFQNTNCYFMDKVFYGIKSENYKFVWAFLNSSLSLFQAEFYGYSLVGGGGSFITVEDLKKIYVLKHFNETNRELLDICNRVANRKYLPIFAELGFDSKKHIREQEPNPLPDRKALDDILFDALGLTEEERKEVYWAVAELVKNRLEKAKSV